MPLWDPYTNCGIPYHSEPNHPTLNPVALLLVSAVEDTWAGFIAYWTIHWWWAGIGMIFLAWHMGSRPSGALLSACAFSFSGFFLGHAEHTTFIIVAAWLPWIIGLGDKAVLTSNVGYALLAGAALGALFLGFIANALILVGLSQFWLQAIYGVVILVAISADALILRRIQRATAERRAR